MLSGFRLQVRIAGLLFCCMLLLFTPGTTVAQKEATAQARPQIQSSEQTPIFKARVNLVVVPVVVYDKKGEQSDR